MFMNTKYIKNDRLGRITLEYLAQARNLIIDIWEKSSDYFNSYQWRETLFDFKLVSIVVCSVFAGLIIFLLIKTNAMGMAQRAAAEKDLPITLNKKKIAKKWKKVENQLNSRSMENHKLAILQADDIFEDVLKILGKSAEIRITNTEEISKVKSSKKNIVEDSRFNLKEEEARRFINIYKKGLIDLGAI